MKKVVHGTNFHTNNIVNYIQPLKDSNQQNLGEDNSDIICNSLWLLMDEADLTYHPRWQKKLIADMCRFIPRILPDKNLEIEIIFTTHSPILLGDMPKGNVIYLTAEESGKILAKRNFSKNTFGQNIYVLFQDSFFLDDPLGQFASDKLQEILSDITKIRGQLDRISKKACSKGKKNKILKEISGIRERSRLFGDRVIQYKLLELLDVCEYRLNSYVQENNSDEKDSTNRELEWMREKKDWIERQIVELEKKSDSDIIG